MSFILVLHHRVSVARGERCAYLGRGQQAAEAAELLVRDNAIVVLVKHADHFARIPCLGRQACFPQHMDLQRLETVVVIAGAIIERSLAPAQP